ncbi:hypothetical protein U1Q18_039946, partial [Sarracenia purpurea var. burkii]
SPKCHWSAYTLTNHPTSCLAEFAAEQVRVPCSSTLNSPAPTPASPSTVISGNQSPLSLDQDMVPTNHGNKVARDRHIG